MHKGQSFHGKQECSALDVRNSQPERIIASSSAEIARVILKTGIDMNAKPAAELLKRSSETKVPTK